MTSFEHTVQEKPKLPGAKLEPLAPAPQAPETQSERDFTAGSSLAYEVFGHYAKLLANPKDKQALNALMSDDVKIQNQTRSSDFLQSFNGQLGEDTSTAWMYTKESSFPAMSDGRNIYLPGNLTVGSDAASTSVDANGLKAVTQAQASNIVPLLHRDYVYLAGTNGKLNAMQDFAGMLSTYGVNLRQTVQTELNKQQNKMNLPDLSINDEGRVQGPGIDSPADFPKLTDIAGSALASDIAANVATMSANDGAPTDASEDNLIRDRDMLKEGETLRAAVRNDLKENQDHNLPPIKIGNDGDILVSGETIVYE